MNYAKNGPRAWLLSLNQILNQCTLQRMDSWHSYVSHPLLSDLQYHFYQKHSRDALEVTSLRRGGGAYLSDITRFRYAFNTCIKSRVAHFVLPF